MSSADPDVSLESLLERLKKGDVAAAEQVFLTFEPYLRLLVRRQISADLQAKFDSVDVVQSIWGDLVAGFRAAQWQFADVNRLRAFLIKATLNRFIDRVRQHRQALEHEQPLAAEPLSCPQPGPVDFVQAEDVWQQLLALCPEQHRELLILKRQGHNLAEIAARTGLHEGSVRRILYDLSRRFASRCQGEE